MNNDPAPNPPRAVHREDGSDAAGDGSRRRRDDGVGGAATSSRTVDPEEEYRRRIEREDYRLALVKKLHFMTQLMKHLDNLVFAEICALYYMEFVACISFGAHLYKTLTLNSCSLFPLILRSASQATFLSPKSDEMLRLFPSQYPQRTSPYLGAILVPNGVAVLLHLLFALPTPASSESSRGYLHGGVVVDVVGQKAPTSRWPLLLLDVVVIALQCFMLAVHVEREGLRGYVRSPAFRRHYGGHEHEEGSRHRRDGSGDGRGGRTAREARGAAATSLELDAEERGVVLGHDSGADRGHTYDTDEDGDDHHHFGDEDDVEMQLLTGTSTRTRRQHGRTRRRRPRDGDLDDEEASRARAESERAAFLAGLDQTNRPSLLDVLNSGNGIIGEYHVLRALRRSDTRDHQAAVARGLRSTGYATTLGALLFQRHLRNAARGPTRA